MIDEHFHEGLPFIQQKFSIDEQVEFHSTASDLDKQTGNILGVSVREQGPHYPEHYIVLLAKPAADGSKAISITEACLRRMSREARMKLIMENAGFKPLDFNGCLAVRVFNTIIDVQYMLETSTMTFDDFCSGMKTETASGDVILYWSDIPWTSV